MTATQFTSWILLRWEGARRVTGTSQPIQTLSACHRNPIEYVSRPPHPFACRAPTVPRWRHLPKCTSVRLYHVRTIRHFGNDTLAPTEAHLSLVLGCNSLHSRHFSRPLGKTSIYGIHNETSSHVILERLGSEGAVGD